MMARIQLTSESRKKIEKYVKNGVLSNEIYASLWNASSKKDFIKCLKEQLFINDITLPRIWTFIVQTIWVDIYTVFDGKEIMLLKEVLKNDGVLPRTRVPSELLNDYMITSAMKTLEYRGIICVLNLSSNEKIIIINPKFRKDVFKDGEG
ncbi:hypothetical protein ACFL96_13470 [Thermoproteota archaeon]